MLATAFLISFSVTLSRIGVTYKALAAGIDGSYAGVLAVAFSLLPACLVVWFGRLGDRGAVALMTVAGAGVLVLATLALLASPLDLVWLLMGTGVLGVGQTLHLSGLQLVVLLASTRMHRDAMLGNYLFASSAGSMIAPLFVGLIDTNDPASIAVHLLDLALGSAVLLIGAAVLVGRRLPDKAPAPSVAVPISIILARPGLPTMLMTGSVVATINGVMPIYLPSSGSTAGSLRASSV
ncbi:MFS transporter [Consotaella aegiceratis]|uniref:MFS transporter n=1 Tax=Consotaella aegiceratis TaxID=3097961 RepID=UPI002F3EC9F4